MANRLANSTSPYLLQHAHNPVEWWPWGEDAFEEARRRDVPIFLSIGYSTCYWCHVMERESFENEAIGRLLSERFVCIKVDREERPDVDDLYMQATLAMRGQGGWPMTCFLEPGELRPFWCGTYFPPQERGGMPGVPQVVESISTAWAEHRGEVMQQAVEMAASVAERLRAGPEGRVLSVKAVADGVGMLLKMFDRQHGGFGRAPKFPQTVFLDLLLDAREHVGAETREAVDLALRLSLDKMAIGGVFDQVGGGFHRYSVDGHWTVPHFEKMLYDSALLAMIYAKAARAYEDAYYRQIVTRTLDFMLREMTLAGGGFASALDAEVDHREGLNYLWTADEVRAILPGETGQLVMRAYGLDRGAHFQDPHHPKEEAKNVVRLDDRPDRLAERLGVSSEQLAAALAGANEALLRERNKRTQPMCDDKVIAAWNGLAMGAMAAGYALTGEARFLEAGLRAARFVTGEMMSASGELLRSSREGKAHTRGFLEDYAFVSWGLLELAAAGGAATAKLNGAAEALASTAKELFADERSGAYFDTRDHQADLFVRPRSTHDGALPSAGSVQLHNLLTLAERTGNEAYADEAMRLLRQTSGEVGASPIGTTNSVRALLRVLTTAGLRERAIAAGVVTLSDEAEPEKRAVRGEHVVEVYGSVERISVGPDQPAELTLVFRVAEGYHVVAAHPGAAWEGKLLPLRIGSLGGTGVRVYAGYPEGEEYVGAGADAGKGVEPMRVYRGTFEIQVAVEAAGEWEGRPLLGVTYQACSETECLAATTVELDVAVDRV